jgi:hypothetical protein
MIWKIAIKKLGIGFNVPEHVRHNEESHVAAADVDLVEVGDTAIASSDSDILELNVHVVLSCKRNCVSFASRKWDAHQAGLGIDCQNEQTPKS